MTPSVDIVVVTHNSSAHIGACLDSIARSEFDGTVHTVVVDNASTDGTLDTVRTLGAAMRLITNRVNRGFAAACNQGIAAASGDLILLLNPDARLQPTTLGCLVTYLNNHPQAAIVGPCLLQEDGSLQRDISATGLFPSFRQALFEYTRLGVRFPESPWYREYFLPGFDRTSDRRVAMVQGACLLFRRRLIHEIGTFDEDYFLYFEETDLCKRATDRGWEIHYVGSAAAIHIGSHSMRGRRPSARHFIASMYRFHRKHGGTLAAALLWAILMPYHSLRTLRLFTVNLFAEPDPQRVSDLRTAWERFVAHGTMLVPRRQCPDAPNPSVRAPHANRRLEEVDTVTARTLTGPNGGGRNQGRP